MDGNSVGLNMERIPKEGFWRHEKDCIAYLNNIALFPSHLRNSYTYLLLGDDNDTKMSLLCVPRDGTTPEILPLSLTFAEAIARLDAECEKLEAGRARDARSIGEGIEMLAVTSS